MKRYLSRLVGVSLCIIFFAMLVEAVILRMVNQNNSYRMTRVLLNQFSDIIKTNKRDATELYASVKEDYKVRAQAVSYIIDSKPSVEFSVNELKKIARLLSIDEIHLFDETGKIYSGSVPKYYNLTFDSGEQMAYFKPMLTDKKLSMCQDVTPNTSENKSMMYAITWNESGDKMIQIGIEPFRLLEVMKRSHISALLKEMPVYDGVSVFVADAATGDIIESECQAENINSLNDIGISLSEIESKSVLNKVIRINGGINYSSVGRVDDYYICTAYSVDTNHKNFLITMFFMLLYLSIADLLIIIIFKGKIKSNEEKLEQYKILSSMSKIYHSMHLLDLKKDILTEYKSTKAIQGIEKHYENIAKKIRAVMINRVSYEYKDAMLEFSDLETLPTRMEGKKIITTDFYGIMQKWFRANFITIEADKNNRPEKVLLTIQDIDEEKNKEAVLVNKSITDELTGCYNRRAYQEDLKEIDMSDDFVYIVFDLNGLKNVNDTIGHDAGDEMIIAGSNLMKKYFAPYGNIYRTGGDEFSTILKIDEKKLESTLSDFDEEIENWSGELVESLSVSYGIVKRNEKDWKSILDMEREADLRMYSKKAAYYQSKGINRRENQKVFFATSMLYLKILKINLTDDSYKIVIMDKDEQVKQKGYSKVLSQWLNQFVNLEQIHEDDREEFNKCVNVEYLKKYFDDGKKLFATSYKRKIKNEYKHVMLEIVPADEYSPEKQICFLYVKNIDLN